LSDQKTFHITTFGCQMNEHDSETLAGMLMEKGYTPAEERKDANIVIFNTCSIRENADKRFFGTLGQLKRRKMEQRENFTVCVCGCMMQQKDAGGKLVSTEKRYTFTVTGQTSLTAVYENSAPEGKDEEEMPSAADGDGLSGGAIAGIAVGSAAVAGLGGFAIFWFAIRKKSIAELIAALKRIGRKR